MNTYLTATYISGVAFAYCIFLLVILEFTFKTIGYFYTPKYAKITIVAIVIAAILSITTGAVSYCFWLATKVEG